MTLSMLPVPVSNNKEWMYLKSYCAADDSNRALSDLKTIKAKRSCQNTIFKNAFLSRVLRDGIYKSTPDAISN